MENKVKILKQLNTDDARFLLNIIQAYNSNIEDIKNKSKTTTIKLEKCTTNIKQGILNLDDISADKYFYTKMKLKINNIMNLLQKTDAEELYKSKTLKNIIYSKVYAPQTGLNKMDIVDVIKELDRNNIVEIKMFANSITEINLFKEEQLKMAMDIINTPDIKQRNEKIYDYTYNYLKKDFISNNYCDFINNKCITQRRFHIYPITRKDGCCFMEIRKCPHLHKGDCDTQCMACRLFSCPYLTKRGISYYANEFVLLSTFLDSTQRRKLVYEFYKTKDEVLNKITR